MRTLRWRAAAGSGWIPFALVVLAAALLAHRVAHVPFRDVALFLGYAALWLCLPGTLCWRLVTARRGPRPLAEDLLLGTLVGYVLEFPAYLLCLAVGLPHAYLAWPAVVVAATVTTPRGRRLWRRTRQPVPTAWSWGVAAFAAYLLAWIARNIWGQFPITDQSLRNPHVDEPFHLALAAGLKRNFPPTTLYVDDTPLQYHWLSHLHLAASSTVTGIDLTTLLRALATPLVMLVVLIAAAHAVVRLTGARWTGLVLLAGLLVVPVAFTGWNDVGGEPLVAARWLISPSAGFANVSMLLAVVLCLEILRGSLRGTAPLVLVTLTFVALLGAKSTSLPPVVVGLVGAVGVAWLAVRGPDRTALLLAGLAVAAFVVATPPFFGLGSHGLEVSPFAYVLPSGAPRWVGPVLAVSVLGCLSTGLGQVSLLRRGGWREPERLFLPLTCVAGLLAPLAFHQQGRSEGYFAIGVMLPLLVGGVLGLHAELESRVHAGRPLLPVAAAYALGLVAGIVLIGVDRPVAPVRADGPHLLWHAVAFTVLPVAVVLALALVVALVVRAGARRLRPRAAVPLTAFLVVTLAGLGTAPTVRGVPDWVEDPWHPAVSLGRPGIIGPGGIRAARWLRDHTPDDALVATNAHCVAPRSAPCDARNFWMAAYAERQFLVEGWAYTSWSAVGRESPTPEDTMTGPFWDPGRLAVNDAAFRAPSAESLARLRARGVRYLLVDRRFPAQARLLGELADRRLRSGTYTVFQLR